MKKIILVSGLLFCSQTIFAQLEKGMISVGLSSGFNVTKTTDKNDSPSSFYASEFVRKNTSYSVAPTISYFFTNRFALGFSVGYAGYTSSNESSNHDFSTNEKKVSYNKTISSGTSISPYVKYYFPLGDQFNFLLKGGFSSTFSTGKTSGYDENTVYDGSGNVFSVTRSNEYGPNKTNTVDMTFGISPGLLFMPGKKIGIEFLLGNVIAYNSRIAKTTYNNSSSTGNSTTNGLQLFNFNTISIDTGLYFFF
jgi:hypothetical protein